MYSFGFPLFFKRVVVLVSVLCPEEGFLTATSISQDVVARKKKAALFHFPYVFVFYREKKGGGGGCRFMNWLIQKELMTPFHTRPPLIHLNLPPHFSRKLVFDVVGNRGPLLLGSFTPLGCRANLYY